MSDPSIKIVRRERINDATRYTLSNGWCIWSSHCTSRTGFAGFQLHDATGRMETLRGTFRLLRDALAAARESAPPPNGPRQNTFVYGQATEGAPT